jgi:antitoxin component HigA of HigAB toxin-antitoxin module
MLTAKQYKAVMARIDVLMRKKGGLLQLEGAELHRLACEAEEYEKVHYPIDEPTPGEATAFRADQERRAKSERLGDKKTRLSKQGKRRNARRREHARNPRTR